MSYIDTVNAFACCLVDKIYDTLIASRKGCLSDCELNKTILLNNKWRMMAKFVPSGTLVSEGYIASASLDISAFATFGSPIGGYISVGGNIIGIIPEGTYTSVDLLGAALVTAVNNGGSGYTASYANGTGLLVIVAPSAGTSYNGLAIDIQINPTFIVTENIYANVSGALEVVNTTSSSLYGKTLIGGKITGGENRYVRIFEDMVEDTASPIQFFQSSFGSPVPFPYTLETKRIAYNPFDNNVFLTGVYGNYTYMAQDYSYFTNANYPSLTSNLYPVIPSPNNLSFQNSIFNPFNNTINLLSSQGVGRLVKRDTVGVFSVTGGMTVDNTVQGDKLAINPANGDIWVLGSQAIYLVDVSGSIVTTIAGTVNIAPKSITYYSVSGSERMFIAFYNSVTPANSYVASYNMNGTIDDASFYSINIGTSDGAIHYSSIFNLLFINTKIGADLYVDLVRLDGTQKQQIPITGKLTNYSYRDDVKWLKVRGSSSNSTGEFPTTIRTFELTDSGSEVFEDALYDGVDAVYTDGAGNCVTQAVIDNVIQELNSECGCCTPILPNTSGVIPSGNTYTIYYGNSTDGALNAAGVEALTAEAKSSYIGTYSFVATSPSEYKYIAIPASLGTPSRFYDPSTGFDVAMDTVYQVTINLIVYNVWRTYYPLGGEIDITVTS